MSKEQTTKQIKADAVNEFVCMMIGALESGFIEENTLTLAQLHRVAENYVKDTYGIELPNIIDHWGNDVAELCGFNNKAS